MKIYCLCIGLVLSITGISQNTNKNNEIGPDTLKSVTFIVRFHLSDMDKDDAAVLKGYVVYIGYEKAKNLDGKRIRISGRVRVVTPTVEQKPGQPVPQERQGSFKYIASPQIEIL